MTTPFVTSVFIMAVLCAASPTLADGDNLQNRLEAMVVPIEPLHAPVYQRTRGIGIAESGAKEVFVNYKVLSPGLRGEILLADITHRFLHNGWSPGLPIGASSDSELQFHHADFSPAPGEYAIYFAILSVSKDGAAIHCSYWFQTKSRNEGPVYIRDDLRTSAASITPKLPPSLADKSLKPAPSWDPPPITVYLEPRGTTYHPTSN
jgi:hypothetical protein